MSINLNLSIPQLPTQSYFPPPIEENCLYNSLVFTATTLEKAWLTILAPLHDDCYRDFIDVMWRIAIFIPTVLASLLAYPFMHLFLGLSCLVAYCTPYPSSNEHQIVYVDKRHDLTIIDKTKQTAIRAFPLENDSECCQLSVSGHILTTSPQTVQGTSVDGYGKTLTIEHVPGVPHVLQMTQSVRGPYQSAIVKASLFIDTTHSLLTRSHYPCYMLYPYCPRARSIEETVAALKPLFQQRHFDFSRTIVAVAQSGLVIACRLVPGSQEVELYVVPPLETQLYLANARAYRTNEHLEAQRYFHDRWLTMTWTNDSVEIEGLPAHVITYEEIRSQHTHLPQNAPAKQWPAPGKVIAPTQHSRYANGIGAIRV